jgi:hypothetical protein
MKKLLLATSLLLSTSAIAAPISVLGFDVGMTEAQVIAHAKSKGYVCETTNEESENQWGFPITNHYTVCYFPKDAGDNADWDAIRITHEDHVDYNPVQDGYITISCRVYSTCQSGAEPIAQALVNKKIVSTLSPTGSSYEGTGPDGDAIVVTKGSIYLIKGQLAETINL